MANFDYMNFNDGDVDTEFVTHAKKFTKEEAVNLFVVENEHVLNKRKVPTIKDVKLKYVKYYPKVPERCGCERTGGCYTYCEKGTRGCFPVWTIEI